MTAKQKDPYAVSRVFYIIEAALEYFVSIAVGTVYLARIAAAIGLPDHVTGILSSFVSLGCGFQILAIFLSRRRPVKRWVTAGHMISQTMFALLYIVPVIRIPHAAKSALFILLLLAAQIIHNVINPAKINWFMSLIEDGKRGRFTASKEMVSLISGIAVSYGLGALADHYYAVGKIETGFCLCGIGLFVLMILHSMTLIFSQEKETAVPTTTVGQSIRSILHNWDIGRLVLLFTLWNMANYATMSFTGTYQAKELGFSASFSSLVIIAGSLCRVAFSRPLGKYADRHSFSRMLCICFAVEIAAFGIGVFTVPANGRILYPVFYILYCIGMGGINSAVINLVYDYVEPAQRTDALAINQTAYGLAGFLITVLLSPVLSLIQKNGSRIGGITVYAQQIFSLFSMLVTGIAFIYVIRVINRIPTERQEVSPEPSAAGCAEET